MNAVETLNILANLFNMSFREHDILIENLLEWTHVVNNFFSRIQQATSGPKKKQNFHPILGMIGEGANLSNEHSNRVVRQQLQFFWSKKMIKCLFGRVLGSVEGSSAVQSKLPKLPPTEILPTALIQSKSSEKQRKCLYANSRVAKKVICQRTDYL